MSANQEDSRDRPDIRSEEMAQVVETFKEFTGDLVDILWPSQTSDRKISFTELQRLMNSEIFKVHVGPTAVCYMVPKDVLCETSKYFRAAFIGKFEEGKIGESKLPDIDTETFETVLKWMMSRNLEAPKTGEGEVQCFIDERIQLLPLVQTYFAADFLDIKELRETAVRLFRDATLGNPRYSDEFSSELQSDLVHPPGNPPIPELHVPGLGSNDILDGKPAFSVVFLQTLLAKDGLGEMLEIVKKCLVRAILTGGEYIGIYEDVFKENAQFALEVMEQMQRSWSEHHCKEHVSNSWTPFVVSCGVRKYAFEELKERRQEEHLREPNVFADVIGEGYLADLANSVGSD